MKRKFIIMVSCLVLLFGGNSVFASGETKLASEIATVYGTPYKYGGTTTKGFDCSGFVRYLFGKFDVSLTRTSSSQAQEGVKVSKDELKVGDLVFFNTSGKGISHVGVFVGNGKFAHSSSSRGVIMSGLDEKYYANRYVTARRILSDDQYSTMMELK